MCLSCLSRGELQQLCHVSQFFTQLSFQLLFETISWSAPIPAILWAPPLALEDAVDALQSSVTSQPDDEAAAPTQCSIRNFASRDLPCGLRMSLFSPRVNNAYVSYLSLFHYALGIFSGLHGVHLADIPITDMIVDMLKALPALSALELSDCEMACKPSAPGGDWELLHLQEFIVVQMCRCNTVYSHMCEMLIALDKLERLIVVDEQWASAMLNAWGIQMLDALRYLMIRVECAQSAAFITFLKHCPRLMSLFLAPDSSLEISDLGASLGETDSFSAGDPTTQCIRGPNTGCTSIHGRQECMCSMTGHRFCVPDNGHQCS